MIDDSLHGDPPRTKGKLPEGPGFLIAAAVPPLGCGGLLLLAIPLMELAWRAHEHVLEDGDRIVSRVIVIYCVIATIGLSWIFSGTSFLKNRPVRAVVLLVVGIVVMALFTSSVFWLR
jgi:apolipoprotein N-acyltransferase